MPIVKIEIEKKRKLKTKNLSKITTYIRWTRALSTISSKQSQSSASLCEIEEFTHSLKPNLETGHCSTPVLCENKYKDIVVSMLRENFSEETIIISDSSEIRELVTYIWNNEFLNDEVTDISCIQQKYLVHDHAASRYTLNRPVYEKLLILDKS